MANGFPWGDVIAGAIGGGGLTKLGEVLFGRKGREVKALGDTVQTLSTQLEKADERMDAFGERLDDCHAKHEECEQGRKEDRREIDGLKRQIDELMKGRIPAYHINGGKRSAGKGEGQ